MNWGLPVPIGQSPLQHEVGGNSVCTRPVLGPLQDFRATLGAAVLQTDDDQAAAAAAAVSMHLPCAQNSHCR